MMTEPTEVDARTFEAAELERIGLIEQIPPRYGTGYLSRRRSRLSSRPGG